MRSTQSPSRFVRAVGISTLALVLFAACGSGQSAATRSTGSTGAAPRVESPSATTRMICASEAQGDLRATLGVDTTAAPLPTWVDHVYSCNYAYPTGSFTLSVKQLADTDTTTAYFEKLGTTLGRVKALDGLGTAAFTTTGGSVVVQKDTKVLFVDVTKLPSRFGVPPDTRANAAVSIAATIMGCWTGA
jgi:hypothetical protein